MKDEILFVINTGLKIICVAFGTLILFTALKYIPIITIIYIIIKLIMFIIKWEKKR